MATDLAVRASCLADAGYLAPRLRLRDREEVEASAGPDILQILRASIQASPGLCWTAYDAHPVFVIGCAPVSPGVGSPWLLGTDAVARYPGALTRISKRHIAVMLRTYPALINYVDARNADSVGWLELLGFTVDEPTPYGAEGRPFHRFTMGI